MPGKRFSAAWLGPDQTRGRALKQRTFQFFGRQADQQGQEAVQGQQGLAEGLSLLRIAAFDPGRVGIAPVRDGRLGRPVGAYLAGGVSQTVITKSMRGESSLPNSSQFLLRRPAVGMPAASSACWPSGWGCWFSGGLLPAE